MDSPIRCRSGFAIVAALAFWACGPAPGAGEKSDDGTTRSTSHRLIGEQCFWGTTSSGRVPLTKIIHEFRVTANGDVVDVLIVFNRDFVDLTYGTGSIGWGNRGHRFRDLVGSDHTELALLDKNGEVGFQAKIDLLSADGAASSGYATQGIDGGDGKLITGSEAYLLSAGTSLDDNFNRYGMALTESSPETDDQYTPNPNFPNWSYFVEYRLSIDAALFGQVGFGSAHMEMVHASPSKFPTDTVEVEEDDCPPPATPVDPFPNCLQLRSDEECLDPGNLGGSEDPGAPVDTPVPSTPTTPTPTNPDPGGGSGSPCQSSSDCGMGFFCNASKTCAPNL